MSDQALAEQDHNSPASAPRATGRWVALVFIALAQLMVALDATIVNIALPSVQRALAFSDAQRQWVITAYTLPFAGLLLLGGNLADTIGRKRAFLVGLAGFAAASALAGTSPNLGVLIGARAAPSDHGSQPRSLWSSSCRFCSIARSLRIEFCR